MTELDKESKFGLFQKENKSDGNQNSGSLCFFIWLYKGDSRGYLEDASQPRAGSGSSTDTEGADT